MLRETLFSRTRNQLSSALAALTTTERVGFASLLMPFGSILICVTYVVRARLHLGFWPSYDHPDPKNLEWPFHHHLVFFGLCFAWVAPILGAGCGCVLLFQRRFLRGALLLGAAASVYVGSLAFSQAPAVDEFFAWYMD